MGVVKRISIFTLIVVLLIGLSPIQNSVKVKAQYIGVLPVGDNITLLVNKVPYYDNGELPLYNVPTNVDNLDIEFGSTLYDRKQFELDFGSAITEIQYRTGGEYISFNSNDYTAPIVHPVVSGNTKVKIDAVHNLIKDYIYTTIQVGVSSNHSQYYKVRLQNGREINLTLRPKSTEIYNSNYAPYPIGTKVNRTITFAKNVSSIIKDYGTGDNDAISIGNQQVIINAEKAAGASVGYHRYRVSYQDGTYQYMFIEFIRGLSKYVVNIMDGTAGNVVVTSSKDIQHVTRLEPIDYPTGQWIVDYGTFRHNANITENLKYRIKLFNIPEPLELLLIKGMPLTLDIEESDYEKGSGEDLSIVSDQALQSLELVSGPSIPEYQLSSDKLTMTFPYTKLDTMTPGTYVFKVKSINGGSADFTLNISNSTEVMYPLTQDYIKGSKREVEYFFGVDYFNITALSKVSGPATDSGLYTLSGNTVKFSPDRLELLTPGTYEFKATMTTGVTSNFKLVVSNSASNKPLNLSSSNMTYMEGETGTVTITPSTPITQFELPDYPTISSGAVYLDAAGRFIINKSLLATLPPGDIPIKLKTASGSVAFYTIKVVRNERRDKHWNQNIKVFNINTSSRQHKDLELTANGSITPQRVYIDGVVVPSGSYISMGNTIIITKNHLLTLGVRERIRVSIDYDGTYSVDFFVEIVNEQPTDTSSIQIDC